MDDVWEDYFFCVDDAEGKYSGLFRFPQTEAGVNLLCFLWDALWVVWH